MSAVEITRALLAGMPVPQPEGGSKDERGRLLIVAGSREVPGAALLAGTAALRAGAGKLQIATAESVAVPLAIAVPEALVIGFPETQAGGIDGRSHERLHGAIERSDAVLIGAGMIEDDATADLTGALLRRAESASFVLDAAALIHLAGDPDPVKSCDGRVVLTPHAGEMAQLIGRSREAVEADPIDAALSAATLLNAVVVMKGANSHVVGPGGQIWTYNGGCVGLGTSGSGDVLASIIVGLLARGLAPEQAACWGVFIHGEAGIRLARTIGPLGFLARELAGEVPDILHQTGTAGG
jgi:ADP-dependent NAD(P)H-hydrate dehydratase